MVQLRTSLIVYLLFSNLGITSEKTGSIRYINNICKISYENILEVVQDVELKLKKKSANKVLEYQRRFSIDEVVKYYKEINANSKVISKYKYSKIINTTINKYKEVYEKSKQNDPQYQLLWALISYSYEVERFAIDPIRKQFSENCKIENKKKECSEMLLKINEISEISSRINFFIQTLSDETKNKLTKKKLIKNHL